jgi:hypothetical protein
LTTPCGLVGDARQHPERKTRSRPGEGCKSFRIKNRL